MKKILNPLVFTVLVGLMFSTGSAQIFRQKREVQRTVESKRQKNDSLKYGMVEAISDGGGVLIKWTTEFESDNIGFNIYRTDSGRRIKVNQTLIEGSGLLGGSGPQSAGEYVFFDGEGSLNSIYKIENISVNKTNHISKGVFPRFESNLKTIAGDSYTYVPRERSAKKPQSLTYDAPNLPSELKSTAIASDSLVDAVRQKWVAAQPGVKIGVTSRGVYRVMRTELQNAGFDVSVPSEKWQLYLNGVEQAINVTADHVEFFGKGIDTTYSGKNIYFLVAGSENGKRIADTFRRPIGGNVIGNNYDYTLLNKARTTYFPKLLNGDLQNYFGPLVSSSPTIYNFNVRGIDSSSATSTISIAMQGFTFAPHSVKVKLNGVEIETINFVNRELYSKQITFSTEFLREGQNSLEMTSIGGSSDFSLFSDLKLDYERLYKADLNQLEFYTRDLRITDVGGFTSPDIRVWDITFPDTPRLVTNTSPSPTNSQNSEFGVNLPSSRQANMFAFTNAATKQAASILQNHPSSFSTAGNTADMIIISPRMWLTEANVWANYRRNDGMTVEVIDVEDAFDEFSYGVYDPEALKGLFNYAKNNWQTPPKYVFLIGDSTSDPRNYTGVGNTNFMPVRFVDTLYEETISDDYLTDFNNDGLTEIAIGRIPAKNTQEITLMFNKVVNFESTLSTAPGRGSLCASDLPNGYDFAGLCLRTQNELPSTIPTTEVNRGEANSKTKLLNELNAGKYIVNYSGHGTTGVWASTGFFGLDDAPTLTNQDRLSIYVMLTCLNGYFIRPGFDSLSEVLIKNPNGAAVVTWSSSGETTPDIQEIMAKRFFGKLGNSTEFNRIGDFVSDAKSSLSGGRDVKLSWVLLGDPTLKVK